MSDDVVDIRKRIEEMRNEVSAAIVSGQEQEQAARALGQLADIAISSNQSTADMNGCWTINATRNHAQMM